MFNRVLPIHHCCKMKLNQNQTTSQSISCFSHLNLYVSKDVTQVTEGNRTLINGVHNPVANHMHGHSTPARNRTWPPHTQMESQTEYSLSRQELLRFFQRVTKPQGQKLIPSMLSPGIEPGTPLFPSVIPTEVFAFATKSGRDFFSAYQAKAIILTTYQQDRPSQELNHGLPAEQAINPRLHLRLACASRQDEYKHFLVCYRYTTGPRE
jgi:hypothetical protein